MAEIVKRVAHNVRHLREALGLSQTELARRAGVSKAAVSQLEAGTSNPTVETVWALAQALGRPFSDLTAELEAGAIDVVRRDDGEWVAGDCIASRLLSRLYAPGVVEVYEVRLTPGAPRRSAPHPRGLREQLVLHEGRARVGPADDPVVLEAGDSVTFAADVAHLYEALDGPAGGLLLMHYPAAPTAGPASAPDARASQDPPVQAAV
jgi:transcriptional regulator with XRE-family HTH domain